MQLGFVLGDTRALSRAPASRPDLLTAGIGSNFHRQMQYSSLDPSQEDDPIVDIFYTHWYARVPPWELEVRCR